MSLRISASIFTEEHIGGDVAFAGPLSTGSRVTFPIDLKVHRTYVFACYMPDRSGGPLHAHGKRMVAYRTTRAG